MRIVVHHMFTGDGTSGSQSTTSMQADVGEPVQKTRCHPCTVLREYIIHARACLRTDFSPTAAARTTC